jgi:HEAT repeat protein
LGIFCQILTIYYIILYHWTCQEIEAETFVKLENIFQNLHDDDIKIRASAIITMGKTGNRGAIGPLIEILGNPKEVDWLRGCAAIALGRLSGDEVILPLIDAMQDDNTEVSRAAISAFGDIKKREAMPYLREILEDEKKAKLHAVAVTVLGEIGGCEVIPTLLKTLESPDNRVRIRAAMALEGLRTEETVPAFIALMNDEDECLRGIAASSLGLLEDARAVEPLIIALDDSTETVRGIAASSLGCLKDTRAISPLERVLGDKSQVVRKQASAALVKIRSSQLQSKIDEKTSIHH